MDQIIKDGVAMARLFAVTCILAVVGSVVGLVYVPAWVGGVWFQKSCQLMRMLSVMAGCSTGTSALPSCSNFLAKADRSPLWCMAAV